jgi:hypothetical protein
VTDRSLYSHLPFQRDASDSYAYRYTASVPPPPATAGIISANTAGRQARPYTLPARSRISRLRSQDPAGSLTHTHPSSPGRMGRSHDSIDRGWGHARPPFLPAPHQPQCGTAGRHNYHASTRANVPLREVPGWTGLSRSRPLITQRCEVVPMATAATLPASPAGPPCMSMPNQYCCLHRRVATTNPSCHSTPRLCLCLFTDRACNACMTAVRRRHPQRVGGRHAILIDEAPSRQTRCVCRCMHACMKSAAASISLYSVTRGVCMAWTRKSIDEPTILLQNRGGIPHCVYSSEARRTGRAIELY